MKQFTGSQQGRFHKHTVSVSHHFLRD